MLSAAGIEALGLYSRSFRGATRCTAGGSEHEFDAASAYEAGIIRMPTYAR